MTIHKNLDDIVEYRKRRAFETLEEIQILLR